MIKNILGVLFLAVLGAGGWYAMEVIKVFDRQ
jgi:hypothetical protein